jgi:hypothetical protein
VVGPWRLLTGGLELRALWVRSDRSGWNLADQEAAAGRWWATSSGDSRQRRGDDNGQAFLLDRTSTPSVGLYAQPRSPTKLASTADQAGTAAPLLLSPKAGIKRIGSCRNHGLVAEPVNLG